MNNFVGMGFNDIYPGLIRNIMKYGEVVPSRNGETKELHPAQIEVHQPRKRLVTAIGRPVNVAFALAEVVWILSGRKDVDMLRHYNSKIGEWSDDGEYFNAAYGFRLRHEHGYDQIGDMIRLLTDDPDSRQATMVLWSPKDAAYNHWQDWDIHTNDVVNYSEKRHTKDRACNVLSHLMIRHGALDWLQIIRSNDAMWGSPYNFMQFSHLQEWIANSLGVPMGKYVHMADSLHIYDWMYNEANLVAEYDLYKVIRKEHNHMFVGDDVLREVITAEETIRKGHLMVKSLDCGAYWEKVLNVFAAHTAYKNGHDVAALEWLLQADPIYGPAQARFYWEHRWYKDASIRSRMERTAWPQPVVDWVTTRVKPVGV